MWNREFDGLVSNSLTFQIYKLKTNNNKVIFEANTINFISLERVGQFDFAISQSFRNNVILSNEDKTSLGLYQSFQVYTEDDIPFIDGQFYILSVKDIKNSYDLEEAFYFESKIQEDAFNEIANRSIKEFTITKLAALKELQGIEFVLGDGKPFESSITLKFDRNSLINNLNFTMEAPSGATYKALPLQDPDNEQPFLFFFNPINVRDNGHFMYLWSFNPTFNLPYDYLINSTNVVEGERVLNIEMLFTFLGILTFKDIFLKIWKVIDVVDSGFQGYSEERIKRFREENGTFQKSEDYINFIVSSYLKNNKLTDKQKNAIKSLILLCSSQLSGYYTFKGGRTEEHKLAFPFFIEKSGEQFFLKSLYYIVENNQIKNNNKNNYLNHNTIQIHDQAVQLPLLPERLTELDFSSNPVDFNNKTYNFNYPFWLWLAERERETLLSFNYQKFHLADVKTIEFETWKDELYYYQVDAVDRHMDNIAAHIANNDFSLMPPPAREQIPPGYKFVPGSWERSYSDEHIRDDDDGYGGKNPVYKRTYKFKFSVKKENDELTQFHPQNKWFIEQKDALIVFNKKQLERFTSSNEVSLTFNFDYENGHKVKEMELLSLWTPIIKLNYKKRDYTIKTANYKDALSTRTRIIFW